MKTTRPKQKRRSVPEEQNPVMPGSSAPLVFISHDTRDADLAEAFSNLLTDASGGILQSFRSSDRKGTAGIEFGAEWYSAIMSKLGQATDVVALLTSHSLDRPWILYEAGVAKGKLNTTVLGVALGIPLESATSGPFAQFQNCDDDETALTKLVLQLITKNPSATPREPAVRLQVAEFIKASSEIIKQRGKSHSTKAKVDETNIAKLFEEVKILFRDLPERVSVASREGPSERRRRSRILPSMLHELIAIGADQSPNGTPLMMISVAFSLFRESQPWAYALGERIQSVFAGNNPLLARVTLRQVRETLSTMRRGPWEEVFIRSADDEAVFASLWDLTERGGILEAMTHRIRSKGPLIKIKKDRPEIDLE